MNNEKVDANAFNELLNASVFLGNVSTKVYGISDVNKIYGILEKEFSKIKSYNVCIFMLANKGLKLRIAAASKFYRKNQIFERLFNKSLEKLRIDVTKSSLCSQVVHEEKTLEADFTDLLREISLLPTGNEIIKTFNFQERKVILSPLYRHKRVLGILIIDAIDPTDQFVAVAKNFAQQISAAMEVAKQQSKYKKTIDKLRSLEEKYGASFEKAMDAIVLADAETGIIVDCNHAACKLVGRRKSEIVGQHQRILHPPEEIVGEFSKTFTHHLKENEGQILETKVITKDGEVRDVEIKANLLEIEGRKILQGIFRDVKEKKKMEKKLISERDLLQALMDNIPDTIYFKDTNSRFTRINLAQARMLGVKSPGEAVGKTDFDYFTLEHAKDAYIDEQNIIRTGKPIVNKVERIRRADGKFLWVTATKVPIKDSTGRTVGIVGISRDITETKQMQDELEKYSKHLEEIVEQKTTELRKAERLAAIGETAAMVGHDLRNPLQAIIGTLYLLREKIDSFPIESMEKKDIEKLFRRVDDEIKYMNKIISDLQDYAGLTKVNFIETDIGDVIKDALASITIPETIKVSVAVSKSLPRLMVDPTLMRRVLTNLILNAVQAIPDTGKIRIEAYNNGEEAIISVTDTGVGIPEENLPKIFQPLFTTKAKGQGFGLATCKKLINLQNGEIMVKSEVGKGSTFSIKIPLKR